MDSPPPLPLPKEELPEKLRKFGDPNAPKPPKMMAAKGMVPVRGADLVTLLVQLCHDPADEVRKAADESLEGAPKEVVVGAASADLHPSILDGLAALFMKDDEVLEVLVSNRATTDHTLARVAKRASEHVTEVIAVNQQRLLGAPGIIEALYKNKNTRMSTADRLVELAARNDVELKGIPAFKDHVEAIKGQLIPEPTGEPLPSDAAFLAALDADDGDVEAYERDVVDGTEEMKEKLRLSVVGDASARSILVRDPNKIVSFAAITSPSMSEPEARAIAYSKEVSDDILRFIGNKKDWLRSYEIKRALAFNPKTPVGISMRFLSHLRPNDLKNLARSRGVPNALKNAARQRLQQKGHH